MKYSISFFLLFTSLLFTEEPSKAEVTALFADYDGQKMHFKGDVLLEQALYEIRSEEAFAYLSEKGHFEKVDRIELINDVLLNFKHGAVLKADFANLSSESGKCRFWAKEGKEILYEQQNPLIRIKSQSGTAHAAGKSINSITAEKKVSIEYQDEFKAFGDLAIYSPLAQGKGQSEILLKTLNSEKKCLLLSKNGDQINASSILLNTLLKTAFLSNANGFLNSEEKLYFSAGKASWNESENTLTLENGVVFEEKSYGQLLAEGPVKFYRNEEKKIERICCEGEAALKRQESFNLHNITLNGILIIDPENRMMIMESFPGNRISYDNPKGTILANKAQLNYEMQGKEIAFVKLILDGDIQIINRFAPSEELQDKYAQYLLADHGEYLIASEELTLSGVEGGRVLLYDKINQLQVSAPGIKIVRDKAVRKESIQGIGDVRFLFIDHELEKLKKRFQFEEEKKSDSNSSMS